MCSALDTRLYALIGKMIVVCIVHGGVGPHFFSKHLFMQLCGINTSPAVLDEVGDYSLKEKLLKVICYDCNVIGNGGSCGLMVRVSDP